jgi:hypothetical protein
MRIYGCKKNIIRHVYGIPFIAAGQFFKIFPVLKRVAKLTLTIKAKKLIL